MNAVYGILLELHFHLSLKYLICESRYLDAQITF